MKVLVLRSEKKNGTHEIVHWYEETEISKAKRELQYEEHQIVSVGTCYPDKEKEMKDFNETLSKSSTLEEMCSLLNDVQQKNRKDKFEVVEV